MLFNTIDFVIFFILVLTIIPAIKNSKFQHVFILLASYFFFYYTSNYLIILLIFTTFWDYYFSHMIYKAKDQKIRRIIFLVSLSGNIGLLGFFKYADFAIAQFNFLGNQLDLNAQIPMLDLALPIGISFYTFHSIGYVIDVYRRQITPSKSLREYAIFIAFFPLLVAGPILRAKQFLPQLREKIDEKEIGTRLRQIIINQANLKIGMTLIALGLLKKMFFADNIAPMVNEIFAQPQGLDSFTIILGTIGFGIQIYGDFSGYSDIAIGAALILGFKLPINFNKPYFAISPSDFWRRWHISLSTWLRDYLYIPLGGNKKSEGRTYLNLVTVMFLGGLWHGASWNFVIWGMLHGGYLAVHKIISDKFPGIKIHPFFKSRIGKIVSILVTQYFIFFAWIPFRVTNTNDMFYVMEKYIILDFQTGNIMNFLISHKLPIALIILFIILHLVSYRTKNIQEKISKLNLYWWTIFLTVTFLAIMLFYNGTPTDFIYFKF